MGELSSASVVIVKAITNKGEYLVGYARDFSPTRIYNFDHVRVIGSYFIAENVLNGVHCTFTFSQATLISKTLTQIGIVPRYDEFIIFEPIMWRLVDKRTNSTIFLVERAVIESTAMTITANATIYDNMSGTGRYLFNRDELAA